MIPSRAPSAPRALRSIGSRQGLLHLLLLGGLTLSACAPRDREQVVVYASQDEVYAEPILQEFTRDSRVLVKGLYDGEAVKTVGIANRLLSEQRHPQADLFWNNEELRTRQLAAQGVFEPGEGWIRIGHRTRQLVIHTGLVARAEAPSSLLELTNARWRGKVAIAFPGFGSTATHLLVLRERWGESAWTAWCQALQANHPLIVEGNSVVVKMVSRGTAWVGVTDSDDIAAGIRERLPIGGIPPGPEMIPLPNTVAVIRGAPNPGPARRLRAYLAGPKTLQRLADAGAILSPDPGPEVLGEAQWGHLLEELPRSTQALEGIFLREGR